MCVEGSIGCAVQYGGKVRIVVDVVGKMYSHLTYIYIRDCGGCGWKDVGMVATHCAVMCGLFVHALRCALLLVSLVFGELFFGESPSLHYLFLHFLAK